MLRIKLDTSPLTNGHGGRGIGRYTRSLQAALAKRTDLELVSNQSPELKPDLVHYPFFDLFFASLPVRKIAPTVVTIHDVIPLMYPEFYKAGIKGRARLMRQRVALRNVQMIVTDSEFSKQQIVRYLRIKPEKIAVVYLAADETIKRPSDQDILEVKQEFSLPETYLLYVGDINYNKNIPQLIKLLKFIPDQIHLVCVGANFKPQPIPEWQWIETQMAMSDVENRVHFLTEVPIDNARALSAIYAGAVAYVQPSLAEGFGLPILEAMQAQTPVVATNTSSLTEVGGEYALYCDPTAEALAEQITTILNWNQEQRQKWVMAAFKWSKKFSWAKTVAETVNVYQRIIHGK